MPARTAQRDRGKETSLIILTRLANISDLFSDPLFRPVMQAIGLAWDVVLFRPD
jgi:hypothetical protein